MVSQDDLKLLFTYNPSTGIFTRNFSVNKWKKGEIAGGVTREGYIKIRVGSKKHSAHRLAFLYMVGFIPDCIDHIDGDKANNRWDNLRIATRSENGYNRSLQVNSTTGVKGLVYYPNENNYGKPRYKAQIRVEGKTVSKSLSITKNRSAEAIIEDLTNWLETTREELHKEFVNNGR